MNYEGIKNADDHVVTWKTICPSGTKESLYRKMISSNEYFYVDIDEE